ncbi:unnamed protein product [Ectocarpus sp. CCAP 1310/34]|nr:unnamed protein product [Ectocarpus sp. CCAP 1310/34]
MANRLVYLSIHPPPPPQHAQNASYGTISENLSANKGKEGECGGHARPAGSAVLQDAGPQNLAGMGGAGGENSTAENPPTALSHAMNVMFLPLWVPKSLLKFVGSAPALLEADIETVKSDVRRVRR